jgi:MSHA pilin protein MshA
MKNINKQSGFTLIELIMVIVILGVLAAFALPRFADLGEEARTASIKGLGGAIKAASNIAHSKSLVSGGGATIELDGVDIDMNGGYPAATNGGIGKAAQISGNDYTSASAAAQDEKPGTEESGSVNGGDFEAAQDPVPASSASIVYNIDGNTSSSCTVTYTEPNIVAVLTGGC